MLLLGDCIAYSAILDGRHVVYTPSYGPETRGGKAKCYVVISDGEIDTPIPETADLMIILNQPSMDFVQVLKKDGLLLFNSSLIEEADQRSDIRKIAVPATDIADSLGKALDLGNTGELKDTGFVANSVMFGAYLATPAGQGVMKHLDDTLEHFLAGKKSSLVALNKSAVDHGLHHALEMTRVSH